MNRIWKRAGMLIGILWVAIEAASAATITDYYDITLRLQIPRTYDNMESKGNRKFQPQRIKGVMTITYDSSTTDTRPIIEITGLTNLTHKVKGQCITYSCLIDEDMMLPRLNLIGDNRTGRFRTGSFNCFLDAEPSYSIGEDDEDNSLLITLAGRGTTVTVRGVGQRIKSFAGTAAGTLGCGCKAYGHISPTRVAGANGPTVKVDDVAAVYGKWTAKWKKRIQ